MPKIGAFTGADLASGDSQYVMFRGDGSAVLASRNLMPNPDFSEFGPQGEPEGWTLDCADRPDGWEVYIRRLTRIDAQGRHVQLPETNFAKQNIATLPLSRASYTQAEPLMPGAPPPEPNRQARIPAPSDAPRVEVVRRQGIEGFAAGDYLVGVAWIVDGKPKTSMRITTSSPMKRITLAQGQGIRVYLPEEAPEGLVGAAIVLSARNGGQNTATIQDRVDLRRQYPESVVLTGPYRRGRTRITPAEGRTRTPYESLPEPRVWFERANANLSAMNVRLSYRIRYKAGTTASQRVRAVSVSAAEDRVLCWRPPEGVLRDAEEWIPEFTGKDGNWYTLPARSPRKEARLFTNDTGKGERRTAEVNGKKVTYYVGGWKNAEDERPSRTERKREDDAFVPGPDALPMDPEPAGMVRLPPGRYAVRTAFSVDGPGEKDEIGPPSAPTVVTLPDSGLENNQPPSGTTDYMIRVFRPGVQNVDNAEFSEKYGDIDLDWEDTPNPGVTTGTDDGIFWINDTSNATASADVRSSARFPINPQRTYYLRLRVNITRWTSGWARIALRFFAEDNTFITGYTVWKDSTPGGRFVEVRVGPQDSPAECEIPQNAAKARLVFQVHGQTDNPRNLRYEVSHVGLFTGGKVRKRLPVDFGLRNDRDEPDKRSDGAERPVDPYPAGAYCRVVQNPDDPPRVWGPTLLNAVSFDAGVPSYVQLWTSGGATATVSPYAGIANDQGLLIQKSAGSAAGGADARIQYSNRTQISRACAWRMKQYSDTEPAPGPSLVLLTIFGSGGVELARLRYEPRSEILKLQGYNGTDANGQPLYVTVDVAKDISVPFALAAEVWVRGVGTSNGVVEVNAVHGSKPLTRTVISDLNWGGVASVTNAASGGRNLPASATLRLIHDDIIDTADGIGDTDPLPTNYVEYYGPPGTPPSSDFFARFERIPVRPNRTYVLSAYLGCENVPQKTEVLRTAFVDRSGRVLQLNEPLAVLRGDRPWRRYFRSFSCPDEEAAYLVCVGGTVGEGFLRMGAAQLEENVLSPWTNANATSGYLTVAFDTYLPGESPLTGAGIEKEDRWLRLGVIANHDYDANGNRLTDVTLQVRAADTKAGLASAPWRSSLSQLLANEGRRRYVEIRANLSTNDATVSPEVRGLYLYVLRRLPVLLRPDASEFFEGAALAPLPPALPRPLMAERQYATGRTLTVSMQRGEAPLWLSGLYAEFYDPEAVEEFVALQEYEDGFVIEDPEREVRYRVRIGGVYPRPSPDDADRYFSFIAEDFDAQIETVEELR